MRRWLGFVVVIVAMVGGSMHPAEAGPTEGRPYGLHVPAGYDAGRPAPLVVLLHSYTSNGQAQAAYFDLPAQANEAGFLLAIPDGTRDIMGDRFWNATDACCDWYYSGVDDVAYIDAIIDEVSARHAVDPARVFLVGHSNGAFMSHRYACERADRVAAIVTLAGMQWKDQSQCRPSSPVSVLQVHGRDDGNIEYEGGTSSNGAAYPGALETVDDWAYHNSCDGGLAATGRRLDLDRGVADDETVETAHSGCPDGTSVKLWTIERGPHTPTFNDNWATAIWTFMAKHPKVPGRG